MNWWWKVRIYNKEGNYWHGHTRIARCANAHPRRMPMSDIRRQLVTMRRRHGAHSRVGQHCSNLIEQLKNYQTENDDAKLALEKSIARSVARLSASIAK